MALRAPSPSLLRGFRVRVCNGSFDGPLILQDVEFVNNIGNEYQVCQRWGIS